MSGPTVIGSRGPTRADSAPKRRASVTSSSVIGSSAIPASKRRVVRDLLQEQRDEERRRPEPGIDEERHDVADGEVARGEDRRRQHRVRRAALVGDERAERADAAEQRRPHRGSDQPSAGCSISA